MLIFYSALRTINLKSHLNVTRFLRLSAFKDNPFFFPFFFFISGIIIASSRGHRHLCVLRVKICDTVVSRPSRDSVITEGINFRRKFCARSFRTKIYHFAAVALASLEFRSGSAYGRHIASPVKLRAGRYRCLSGLPVAQRGEKKWERNAMERIMIIVITRRHFTSSICRAIYHYYLVNNVTTISG